MPHSPRNMDNSLMLDLKNFLDNNDFVAMYKSYDWGNDNFRNGFRDILDLEIQLSKSLNRQGIRLEDVKAIARWGKLKNPKRISGKEIVLDQKLLNILSDEENMLLASYPTLPLCALQESITKGIGPTYFSKILLFAFPEEYGAIDTRCVRVFGKGDLKSQQHDWINLRARNNGYGWYIPAYQADWPSGYGLWIDILRFFSEHLSIRSINCPHPSAFIREGLRVPNKWACADVQTALFAYASSIINR